MNAPFDPSFFLQPTAGVARGLLGALLVQETPKGRVSGHIVETEAYLGELDPASHSYKGPTQRNAAMFGPPGHAYVYFIYGNHYCLNVTTQSEGTGEAVLIRALVPHEGLEIIRRNRNGRPDKELTNGPGKLCQALGIGRAQNGHDFLSPPLQLFAPAPEWSRSQGMQLQVTPRIGISQARDLPLRFLLA